MCLIDPEINTLKEGNTAISVLDERVRDLVKDNCYKLVGMTMSSIPASAARTYFNAAIDLGFDKLIVDMTMGPNVKYNIYETLVARQNYENGDIEACCGNERCSIYLRTWIFCADESKWHSFFVKFGKLDLSSDEYMSNQ